MFKRHRLIAPAVALALAAELTAATPAQNQPGQQPAFREGVDVIRLDVTVLDKDRRPIRGLAVGDFTVLEDGRPQRLVNVAEIDAAERTSMSSAWMRLVTPDIAMNDLSDQVGEGRLFALVLDDANLPDDTDLMVWTREAARHVIDAMSPVDVAAVIYVQDAGKSQDFTSDRQKLLDAIDRFNPNAPGWVPPSPQGTGPIQGDTVRFSSALVRSQCFRQEPAIPTLDTVVSRLASVPGRRKTLIFFSVGVPLTLVESSGCGGSLASVMRETLRKAQGANVNIHGIDPTGYDGYSEFLRMRRIRYGPSLAPVGGRVPSTNVMRLRDFMRMLAENTGGRAVVATDAIEPELDRIFDEDASYYLLGYQTANGNPDGKFRKIDVKVKRPGAIVLAKRGYWAAGRAAEASTRDKVAPTTFDLALSGMSAPDGLPLRAQVVPVAAAGPASSAAELAVMLSVRLPPLTSPVQEKLTVTRTVYDADGRAGAPSQETVAVALQPGAGDELRFDILRRLSLAPGRYQVRLSASSATVGRSGSVYADVEVPDFVRGPLTMSGLVIGGRGEGVRTDELASLLPIVPTARRDVSASEPLSAFTRIWQPRGAAAFDVEVRGEILDSNDAVVASASGRLPASVFTGGEGVPYVWDLPLAGLHPGPHVLSLTVRLPTGRTARRDMLFRVR